MVGHRPFAPGCIEVGNKEGDDRRIMRRNNWCCPLVDNRLGPLILLLTKHKLSSRIHQKMPRDSISSVRCLSIQNTRALPMRAWAQCMEFSASKVQKWALVQSTQYRTNTAQKKLIAQHEGDCFGELPHILQCQDLERRAGHHLAQEHTPLPQSNSAITISWPFPLLASWSSCLRPLLLWRCCSRKKEMKCTIPNLWHNHGI